MVRVYVCMRARNQSPPRARALPSLPPSRSSFTHPPSLPPPHPALSPTHPHSHPHTLSTHIIIEQFLGSPRCTIEWEEERHG